MMLCHRSLHLFVGMILFFLMDSTAYAIEEFSVLFLIDEQKPVYQRLVNQFSETQKKLVTTGRQIKYNVEQIRPNSKLDLKSIDLIVSIGTQATLRTSRLDVNIPVLSVLIPRLSFEKIKQNKTIQLSAIYLDQPIERRLHLIRNILPRAKNVGVLFGPSTAHYQIEFEKAGGKNRIKIQSEIVAVDDNPVSVLERVLDRSEALLAVIDPMVFNRANVQSVLLTAYRYRIPLIGVSPAYIKAGALAAVHSTPEQIGRQLAEALLKVADSHGGNLPVSSYPNYFSVSVNRSVARSLGIEIGKESLIKKRLQYLEANQ